MTVGFTARVDAEMNVGAVSETITVSGASPLVDTTSTSTSTELTREQLEVLPTSRDGFHAFMNQVPGVRTNLDVGSSGLGDTVEFRLYGQLGSPWQMVEGVLASAPTLLGAQGSHVDFNAVDGTRVQTVGSQRGDAAARPAGRFGDQVRRQRLSRQCRGVRVGRGIEGDNITDDLERAGIRLAKLHTVQDFAGTFGGRIVRNKLWFFGGARFQKVERDILDAFDPDGTPIMNIKKGEYHFEKSRISRRPPIASRASTTGPTTTNCGMRAGSSRGNRWKRRTIRSGSRRANGKPCAAMRWSPRSSTGDGTSGAPVMAIAPGKVSTLDIATQFVTGDNFTINGRDQDDHRDHTKAVVSYYKPDLLGGNHEFKLGVDHL